MEILTTLQSFCENWWLTIAVSFTIAITLALVIKIKYDNNSNKQIAKAKNDSTIIQSGGDINFE